MQQSSSALNQTQFDLAALFLRLGLGILFIIGGISKLSQLLSSSHHDAIIANYMGSTGYINALFQQYLFTGWLGDILSPAIFLISLSAFELISGIALVIGFLIRPLALIYAFLLWSFVFSLPVMTVPNAEISVSTYTSPAIFVQIRDIALSGMMFVLFNLGSGSFSIERTKHQYAYTWDSLGLLLRVSIALMCLIGGFFGAFAKVPNFATWQPLLTTLGLMLLIGLPYIVRIAGAILVGVMLWYMVYKLNLDKSLIANLNAFKREFAFLAAGAVLMKLGGGNLFTLTDLKDRFFNYISPLRERKRSQFSETK